MGKLIVNSEIIAHYTGLNPSEIKRFSQMSAHDIYRDAVYVAVLKSLDKAYLESTLQLARAAYEKHIDAFKDEVKARYGLNKTPMSALTLGNWVVGVLQYPASAHEILKLHNDIKGEVFSGSLEELLDMLNEMPKGAAEWQQALCLLSFPLMLK
jgi:hypothetical protein